MYLRIWMNNDQLNGSLIGIQLEKHISVNSIVNGEPKQDSYRRSTSCASRFLIEEANICKWSLSEVISDYFVVLKYFTTNKYPSNKGKLMTIKLVV